MRDKRVIYILFIGVLMLIGCGAKKECSADRNAFEKIKDINNSTIQTIQGNWQKDCNIQNSGIDIVGNGGKLVAYVPLVPPAIFINANIKKGEQANVFYLTYDSQDMNPPAASDNEIDEANTSKGKNIGKLVLKNGTILFTWYGLYNNKTKMMTNTESQFEGKSITLKRCRL